MATLEEYNTRCSRELKLWRLFSVNDQWRKKVGELAQMINEAIMEEYNIEDKRKIGKMPGDTPLGEKADLLYKDFTKLLDCDISRKIDLTWESI